MRSLSCRSRKSLSTRWVPVALLLSLGFLGACSDESGPLAPDSEPIPASPAPEAELTLATLHEAAQASPLRLEVEIQQTGAAWLAQEVEVETETDRTKMERIESPVVAADRTRGTLSVRIGNLTIDVSSTARFELAAGDQITRDVFFDILEEELESGNDPGVDLLRPPVSEPQSPQEPAFVAEVLRLDLDSSDEALEFNVDARHVAVQGEAVGTLTLLNTRVDIDLTNGTQLEQRSEAESGAIEIKGLAAGADPSSSTVDLADGRILRLGEGSQVKVGGMDQLSSVEEVQAALADGLVVKVDAEAVLESDLTYVAVEVEFEVDAANGEFEGRVVSADADAGTFTLANGRVYLIGEGTAFDPDGALMSLTAIAGALDAGDKVTVVGQIESNDEGTWIVSVLKAEVNGEDGPFEGRVVAVSLDDGTFTLANKRTYTVVEGTTEFDPEGTLTSLAAMAGALDAGDVVTVIGEATKDPETGAWVVGSLRADTNAGPGEFEGRVVEVDLDTRTFTLASKRTYTVGEGTVFEPESALSSLEAMAGALDAGDVVTVEGQAAKDELGAWLVSSLTVAVNVEDGPFEGRVVAVSLDDGTFTLANKRTYTVVEGTTEFDPEGTLTSLAAMAGALGAGDVVTVIGEATKDPETGAWVVGSLRADTNAGPGEFEGRVVEVDLDTRTFTLASKRTYTVGEGTVFEPESALSSLEAMAGALDAGDVVTVEGQAAKDELGAWLVSSLTAAVNVEDGPFEGRVVAVSLDDGTFTLANKRTYTVVEGTTEFDPEGTLTSLAAMAGALDAGDVVTVIGEATKDPETGAWVVGSLRADTNAGPGEFEGRVVEVDLDTRTFTLASKRTYTVGEGTVFEPESALSSLEAMAGALDAGDVVTVEGQAAKDELGAWLVSSLTVAVNVEEGPFEGRVVAVSLDDGTFTLANKRTYTVGEGTVFEPESALDSLEAIAEGLASDQKIHVAGQAERDPLGGTLTVTTVLVWIVGG